MKRRDFLTGLGGVLFAAPLTAKLAGCQVGEHYPPGEPPPPGGGGGGDGAESFTVMNSDASGHTHSFQIKCTQATADGWTYTAQGAHTHQVTLNASQLGAIFAGMAVTVNTSDGHAHTWVIQMPSGMCAAEPPPAESWTVVNSDASGHSHNFDIQCSHVDADGWTYTARGAHSHSVVISRNELAAVFAGQTITVNTSDGHPHTWVISKPAGACGSSSGGGGGGGGGGGSGGGYY